jgi:hypothetical protein
MLDRDLARLYGVTTKRLNEQLRRNLHRFPKDFAFRLTLAEAKDIAALRSQNATLKRGHHIKHPPHVFTERGAIMLASVLNSRIAVQASIYVVRAFVQMRAELIGYADLSRRIDALAATYDVAASQPLYCAPRQYSLSFRDEKSAFGDISRSRDDHDSSASDYLYGSWTSARCGRTGTWRNGGRSWRSGRGATCGPIYANTRRQTRLEWVLGGMLQPRTSGSGNAARRHR